MLTYKYKLYKTHRTVWLDRMLRECAFVWNHALALQRRYYRMYGKYVSTVDMQKHFTKRIKRHLLYSHNSIEVLQRLAAAYQRFFKKLAKRPPKFRCAADFQSFAYKLHYRYKIDGNCFTINRLKKTYKFHKSRNFDGAIKTVRVKRAPCGDFWLYVVTDAKVESSNTTHDGAVVGIDFGLKTYLTLSDGRSYENPQFFKQTLRDIRKAHRRLSQSVKGSNNHRRRRLELSRLYRGISNHRDDYQWRLAHDLCQCYSTICLETLILDGMRRLWGRKVSDLSHASFVSRLEFVATKYNTNVVHVDKWFASSKLCSGCGYVNKELRLVDRSWLCPQCGTHHDRDLNAALNIRRSGMDALISGSKPTSVAAMSESRIPRL